MSEEYTYPRFTPDMKKTHTILIPNMAPVQFRLMAAIMEQAGLSSKAHSVVFALPVSQVSGIMALEEEE